MWTAPALTRNGRGCRYSAFRVSACTRQNERAVEPTRRPSPSRNREVVSTQTRSPMPPSETEVTVAASRNGLACPLLSAGELACRLPSAGEDAESAEGAEAGFSAGSAPSAFVPQDGDGSPTTWMP